MLMRKGSGQGVTETDRVGGGGSVRDGGGNGDEDNKARNRDESDELKVVFAILTFSFRMLHGSLSVKGGGSSLRDKGVFVYFCFYVYLSIHLNGTKLIFFLIS